MNWLEEVILSNIIDGSWFDDYRDDTFNIYCY